VPALADAHRIAATADEFLDKLGAAYVHLTLADLLAGLEDEGAVAASFGDAAAALRKHDALTVLAWARRAGVVAKGGTSVLNAASMAEAIAALGKLAGADLKISSDTTIETPDGQIEVLVSVGIASASRLRKEAQNRLDKHVSKGEPKPVFLIGGGIGWAAPEALPADILGEGDEADVIDGPMHAEPTIIRAQEVLAA
jgi:hypothetical protein